MVEKTHVKVIGMKKNLFEYDCFSTIQYSSGGPLMVYDSTTDTWNIAGITSYGYGCAAQDYPGVYTRVSMFVNWINARINGEYEPLPSLSITTIPNGFLMFLFCICVFFKNK